MTLRAEIVLAKATAGQQLSVGQGTDRKLIITRPEFAFYLRGLQGNPLWLVQLMYADDSTHLADIVRHLAFDLALNFELQDVDRVRVDYQRLARKLLLHFVTRSDCPDCRGTGQSKWHVRACGLCGGLGVTKLHDLEIAAAAGIARSTYSRRKRIYDAIMRRVLTELTDWHDTAFEHIRRNIG